MFARAEESIKTLGMTPSPQQVSGSGVAEILRVLNGLVKKKLLSTYAIGGGVAALYYIEPVLTFDFDVICRFPGRGALVDPSPVFAELKSLGFTFGFEDRIMIAGVPVQFIPAAPGLMEEALEHARAITLSGVRTRILTLEYLAALMLQLFRPKDRAKLDLLFGEREATLDAIQLRGIARRYKLTARWERFHEA